VELIFSVSTSVNLSGSLNCEGNKRANDFITTVDVRLDARPATNTSSQSTTFCTGSSHDSTASSVFG
jgi:hypothetical protein